MFVSDRIAFAAVADVLFVDYFAVAASYLNNFVNYLVQLLGQQAGDVDDAVGSLMMLMFVASVVVVVVDACLFDDIDDGYVMLRM